MRLKQRTALAVTMLTLASAPLMAESQQSKSDAVKWAYKTTDLIDHEVISDNGNKLGTINELVFDETGKISYFVLSRGGFLGVNETKILVPWSALGDLDAEMGSYIAKVNSAAIENAPTLSPNDLAELTNPELTREVDKHFMAAGMRDTGMASAPDSEKIRQKFSKYDKDSDGMLSREEAKEIAGLASSFKQADGDDDGSISRAEYARFVVTDK
jgi:sporulation protein YlmC with PRC-barrel domain